MKKDSRSGVLTVAVSMPNAGISKIAVGNCQGRGSRPYQEDSFGFSPIDEKTVKERGFTAVVADGMGGLSESNLVSGMLVKYFTDTCFSAEAKVPLRNQFYDCIKKANTAAMGSGGGSTIVAVYCCAKGVFWCSLGDSRMYLSRKGKLFRVTEDMDYERSLLVQVLDDEILFDEADENPKKAALIQYIGMSEEPMPECSVIPFLPCDGDRLLICSDGVYNALSENELVNALSSPAQQAADVILMSVTMKNYENQDNFTAIVLEFQQ